MRMGLHGPVVVIDSAVPAIARQIGHLLGPFLVPSVDEAASGDAAASADDAPCNADERPFASIIPSPFETTGTVLPYEESDVLRHLSPTAQRIQLASGADETLEVYQDQERFWLIDDRWGMSEINLLRGYWRSWVLPAPRIDAMRCTEMAVLWPLAQLLRGRGVYLLPAVSAVRDGWAFLAICPFSLEPELRELIPQGYHLIGQRWTALREEEGRLALLHMPGRVERPWAPRLANPSIAQDAPAFRDDPAADADVPGWVDLAAEYRSRQEHAFCDAVIVASPGRRSESAVRDIATPADATALIRRAWPLPDLHPLRRQSQLPAKMARCCRCVDVHLSREPRDLSPILDAIRTTPAGSLAHDQTHPLSIGRSILAAA